MFLFQEQIVAIDLALKSCFEKSLLEAFIIVYALAANGWGLRSVRSGDLTLNDTSFSNTTPLIRVFYVLHNVFFSMLHRYTTLSTIFLIQLLGRRPPCWGFPSFLTAEYSRKISKDGASKLSELLSAASQDDP